MVKCYIKSIFGENNNLKIAYYGKGYLAGNTHSTAIEGSTLTEMDIQLLFDEGVTAKGKLLVYHLMNEDLKNAYELAKEESEQDVEITPAFLQKLNATLIRTTGSIHNAMDGSFDSSKGEFRLCGVTAGVGSRSYMSYQKVPVKVFKEDRADYILSLQQLQEDETSLPFLDFMTTQLRKSLFLEIKRYNTYRKRGFNFMF